MWPVQQLTLHGGEIHYRFFYIRLSTSFPKAYISYLKFETFNLRLYVEGDVPEKTLLPMLKHPKIQ